MDYEVFGRVEWTRFDQRLADRSLQREYGGQFEWYWPVPDVIRSLAARNSIARVPAQPRHGDDHAQSLGYWGALHYLVMYRLGWARPHRGFQWWYDNGKPFDDPTLAFISQVWDRDGGLDVYVAWLVARQPVLGLLDIGEARAATSNGEDLSPRWTTWLSARQRESDRFEHFGPDGDGLHLTRSVVETGDSDSTAVLLQSDPSSRRAVMISSAMDSWYQDLARLGGELPVTGVSSWKVDVFVKPVGFLGTFRRSMTTDFWFSGRHRFHTIGN